MSEKTKDNLIRIAFTLTFLGAAAFLCIPFFGRVTDRTRVTIARATAVQLKQSIETYFTEYRRFPISSARGDQTEDSELLSNASLMSMLTFEPVDTPGMSPRRIDLYEGKPAKRKSNGQYHSGILTHPDGSRDLLDPWGNLYRLIVDANRDDEINPPDWTESAIPIYQSVTVWSPGPDGKDESANDNITTW